MFPSAVQLGSGQTEPPAPKCGYGKAMGPKPTSPLCRSCANFIGRRIGEERRQAISRVCAAGVEIRLVERFTCDSFLHCLAHACLSEVQRVAEQHWTEGSAGETVCLRSSDRPLQR